jgi:hypothetical protein
LAKKYEKEEEKDQKKIGENLKKTRLFYFP